MTLTAFHFRHGNKTYYRTLTTTRLLATNAAGYAFRPSSRVFGLLQIRRVEALVEAVIDRRQKIPRFYAATLVKTELSETRGSTQFPELGLLLLGDAQGFAIQFLSCPATPLPQQNLSFVPVQLRCE